MGYSYTFLVLEANCYCALFSMRQYKCRDDIWGKTIHKDVTALSREDRVCRVCLCGACVRALIKDTRFFKHIRAILSNCFTPSSISTRTKDRDCSTKPCSPFSTLLYHGEQTQAAGIIVHCSTHSTRSECSGLSLEGHMKHWHKANTAAHLWRSLLPSSNEMSKTYDVYLHMGVSSKLLDTICY